MAYSNQTTHYGLPLPTGADKSTFLDTNQAFTDVDTALYAAETGISGVQSDVQDLNTEVTNLSTTVTSQATDIGALQNGLTSTNLLLQDTIEDVAELNSKLTELTASTSVGVTTSAHWYEALLALKNAIDFSKVTSHSTIDSNGTIFHLVNKSATTLRYSNDAVYYGDQAYITSIVIGPSVSVTLWGSTAGISDLTQNTVGFNGKIDLYY